MEFIALIDEKQHFLVVDFSASCLFEAVRYAENTFCDDGQTVLLVCKATEYLKANVDYDVDIISRFLASLYAVPSSTNHLKSKNNGNSRKS